MSNTSELPDSIDQDEDHNTQSYQVQISMYEGPMDLLLHLIEREELDITRVALAQVTDQYLAYLAILKQVEADFLTDFLVVAAKLLFIKSRALLPKPPPSLEEEEEEDIGDQLARQLRIYKQFKTVAEMLRQRETDGLKNFIRVASPPKLEPKLTLGDVTLDDLVAAVRQALEVRPPDPAVSKVVSPMTVTIGEQMALIRAQLTQHSQIRFQSLLGRAVSRVEIIVTFLAVLELIKQNVVVVQQDGLFGDIVVSPCKTELQPKRSNDDSEETGSEETGSITGQALSQA